MPPLRINPHLYQYSVLKGTRVELCHTSVHSALKLFTGVTFISCDQLILNQTISSQIKHSNWTYRYFTGITGLCYVIQRFGAVLTPPGYWYLPVCDWLLQVVALREAVPEEVVSGALGWGVVVDGGVREKRTGQPSDLPLRDWDGRLTGLAPVITHGLWDREREF